MEKSKRTAYGERLTANGKTPLIFPEFDIKAEKDSFPLAFSL
jgi:hypothetical protein